MDLPTAPHMQVTFSPAWWHAHYGLDFGEAAWTDPITRTELDRERRRLLWERFGDVGLGEEDPQPRPNVQDAYGHRFMAAVWGCEIVYLPDQAPAAHALPDAAERVRDLETPDLDNNPVLRQAFADAEILEQRYGKCEGGVNGGPLNHAVSVYGGEILSLCLSDPDLARRKLLSMARTLFSVFINMSLPINHQQFRMPWPAGGIGNCPVCMVAPQTYAEVVRPADAWLREHYTDWHLHHCGVFTPYIEVYQSLRPTTLDVGWGTDWRAVREAYPTTPLSLEIQDAAILGQTPGQLDDLVGEMVEAAGPPELIYRIWVAEAAPETPDETVRALMTAGERLGWARSRDS